MNDTIIYILTALVAFIAYKKYAYYQVLKLVPSLLAQGGQIVDVRSAAEFICAHKEGSINIPLDSLSSRVSELDDTKPIIVCCASGSRSGMARRTFIAKGFKNVHNAGTWSSLLKL
jgi:rhodanese-related sulfurtransferase